MKGPERVFCFLGAVADIWSSWGQYLSKIINSRLLSSFPWEWVLPSWQYVPFLGAVPRCSQKSTILGLFKVQLFFIILVKVYSSFVHIWSCSAQPTKGLEDCFWSYLHVFTILLSMQLSLAQTCNQYKKSCCNIVTL